jgi:tRNA(Ile)-lysidine synthase
MASLIKEAKGGANVAYVDHCKVQFPLSVVNRPSLAGRMVRFQPLGMAGSKSLKEYFMDRKIARRERDRIPLVMGGGEVIWVGGHQISEAVRLDGDTRVVLKLTLGPV